MTPPPCKLGPGPDKPTRNNPNSDPNSDPKIELGPWRINTLKTLFGWFLNETRKKGSKFSLSFSFVNLKENLCCKIFWNRAERVSRVFENDSNIFEKVLLGPVNLVVRNEFKQPNLTWKMYRILIFDSFKCAPQLSWRSWIDEACIYYVVLKPMSLKLIHNHIINAHSTNSTSKYLLLFSLKFSSLNSFF